MELDRPQGNRGAVDFEGSLVEARLDSTLPLFTFNNVSATLDSYISAGYDCDLNQHGQEWSGVEFGMAVPITFKGRYTVTPYVRTGIDLGWDRTNYAGSLQNETVPVWGGVQFAVTF